MRNNAPIAPVPKIPPVPEGVGRPLFSVMIPTYECGDFLEQTLRGVLDQDSGPDRMQIAVVDDRSTTDRQERIIRSLAPSRIEYYRQESNVGLARNWNGCIERSRGRWVHILHQDDLVLPGFYEKLGRADEESSRVGAAFCRHILMEEGRPERHLSPIERPTAGILDGWLETISRVQHIQCPSIIVRREVYERLGGFRTDLVYALDWEMWNRIAAHDPYWFEPEALACCRTHPSNETARLIRADRDLDDIHRAIRIIASEIPAELAGSVGDGLLQYMLRRELNRMVERFKALDLPAALDHARRANLCDPTFKFSRAGFAHARWALKIVALECLKSLRGRGSKALTINTSNR